MRLKKQIIAVIGRRKAGKSTVNSKPDRVQKWSLSVVASRSLPSCP